MTEEWAPDQLTPFLLITIEEVQKHYKEKPGSSLEALQSVSSKKLRLKDYCLRPIEEAPGQCS